MVWIILLAFVGIGALFAFLAKPLIAHKIKPNPAYGVRTDKTLSDATIWYKANEYGGRTLLTVGKVTAGAAVALSPLGWFNAPFYALGCAGILLAAALWMCVRNNQYIATLSSASAKTEE